MSRHRIAPNFLHNQSWHDCFTACVHDQKAFLLISLNFYFIKPRPCTEVQLATFYTPLFGYRDAPHKLDVWCGGSSFSSFGEKSSSVPLAAYGHRCHSLWHFLQCFGHCDRPRIHIEWACFHPGKWLQYTPCIPPLAPTGIDRWVKLCISMVWNHLDLASNRLFKREVPTAIVMIVDALGFLSFLALLIANGIVASNLGWWRTTGDAVLLAYASVPWMFCWFVERSLESVLMLTYYCC